MRRIYLMLLTVCLGSTAFAGGYRVALQGVRQASMGITSSMHARDASIAFFNPAGIAFIESKFSVSLGGFGVMSNAQWQNASTMETAETDSPMGTPVYFAATYRPLEDLTVGVSVTTPFGNTVKWPSDWAGKANVTEISLASYFIQPTVAVKFNDWFSAGAGFIYAMGEVNLQRTMSVAGNDIGLEIDETDAHGLGFNVGVYFKPSDKVNVGLAYRSKVDMKAVDGDVIWTDVPQGLSGNMPFTSNKFGATLPLPSEFLAGFSYQVSERLMLAAEVSVNGWSSYKNLDIVLEDEQSEETYESKSTKNFLDRAVYRVGGEYMATENLAVRLGYYFDESPSPAEHWSPETPSTNLHAFTGGLGFRFGEGFYIDAYGQYNMGVERYVHNVESGFQGDVNSNALIFGLGLSYNFN